MILIGFLIATVLVVGGSLSLDGQAYRQSAFADPTPASIDSIFARFDHTNTPGCAVGVYRDDRMVYGRGYGMADLNQGVPIGTNTVFYIASTSKQFAAASIALLEEAGTLSLRDPVRKWIPELPAYTQPITIAHLVHHTSGVRDYLGLWGLSGRSFADEVPQVMALDLIARQRALDFAPGTRYSYSNSGYLLLSEIIKRASGKSRRLTTPPRDPLIDGAAQRYAFGLMPGQYRGLEIVEHGGAFIGFRAQLLRFPSEHLSVSVPCNDYTAQPDQLARRVAAVPPSTLDRWTGRYEVVPGAVARIARDAAGLIMHLSGQRLPLSAIDDLSDPQRWFHARSVGAAIKIEAR